MVKYPKYKRIFPQPRGSFFLFGPRGSGKSTWLRQHYSDALFIDLLSEQTFQSYLVDAEPFVFLLNQARPKSTVVIDEIQRLPGLLNEVHRFIEQRQLTFVLSGSSARKLRRAGTNLLGGRAVRKEMFPLLPAELGQDFDLDAVLTYGSLPLLWQNRDNPDVLEAYVQTYLKEEIQAEAITRNLQGFARFLGVAALFHAQVLNATSLSRDAGVARTTVLGYIEILEDTLLAFRLQPYEGRLRVKEKSHPKLYWIDPGIVRGARKKRGPVVDEERGPLFEGWLASVLKAYQSYHKLFDDWNYWCPTESDKLEVDFLLWRGERCIAIEAKASKRIRPEYTRGLRAFHDAMKNKPCRRLVVYLGKERLLTDDGIELLPLEDFLLELEDDALWPR